MLVSVVTDNLYRVLVSTYSTVSTQTVELSLVHAFATHSDFFLLWKRSESDVIYDTDSETVLWFSQSQVFIYRKDLSRSSIVRTQTVTTTYDNRSIFLAIEAVLNIQVQRFTVSTRFLSSVENSDTLSSLRNSCQEVLSRERTIQVNSNQTYLFALSCEVVDYFADSFCYRTHSDDYAVCIFSTIVIEQAILAASDFRNLFHVFFYDSRNCFIVSVARFTVSEECIRVFSHTTSNWLFWSQCTATEFSQSLLVNQRSEVFVFQHFDLLDFVRCTETVEEVQEWNASLDSSQVSYTSQVHNFLYRTFSQHSETCLTARHNVLVVAEDTQCVRSQSTCRNVEYARQEFTCDFVHIWDHQQQTLRSCVSRSQGTCLQRTVNSTCCTTF